MADILEQHLPRKKGPSMMVQVAVLGALTVAALGAGWFAGTMLRGEVPAAAPGADATAAAPHSAADAGHGGGGHGGKVDKGKEEAAPANPLVLDLPAITTNLAAPADTWFRMELSVQLDQPSSDPMLATTIQQDLLSFLRTVKLHQIEGASGFQHLKADLAERAAIRSDGHIRGILVRTLIFE
jgi:flagellar protein FliL